MKKLFLPLIVMVTMLACQAPETKTTDAAASEDIGPKTPKPLLNDKLNNNK